MTVVGDPGPARPDARDAGDAGPGLAAAVAWLLLGCAGLAAMALLVTKLPGTVSPIWLGDAYATCWLLARRHRAWPEWPALLLAMSLANVCTGLLHGNSLWAGLIFVPINVASVLMAAVLLSRYCTPERAELPPRVLALALLLGGLLPAAAGGLMAGLLLPTRAGSDAAGVWLAWVIGGVAGALTVLPLGLHIVGRQGRLPRVSPGSAVLLLLTLSLSALVLWGVHQPFVYICVLLVALAALRGYATTCIGVLLVSTLIGLMWSTGLYVAPPATGPWGAVLNHLPHAVALVPALLLAASAHQSAELRARFDGLYLAAPEAIALGGPGETLLAANPAAERLIGLSEAQMRQQGLSGLVDPTDPRRDALEAERAAHGVAHGMLRLRRGDGSVVECDITTARYQLPSGEWASHSFVRDATLRLQQERALREGSQLLQRLSDMVPGMLSVFESGPEGPLRVTWASRASVALLGVSLQEGPLPATVVFQHVAPGDLERLWQRFADSARDSTLFDELFSVQQPGRPLRWMSMQSMPLRMADGSTQWHGYMADITERRAVAEEARKQGARLELALASGGIGTWDNDVVAGTNFTSDRWNALLGYRPGEVEQTLAAFDALIHPDDLPALHRRRFSASPGAQDTVLLYRARHRNGSWRWVESRAMAVERDENGRPLRLMGTAFDVTERVEAERLRAERDRAEAADRAKTAFMSRMSHELRTPLNAVIGFTQVLASDPDGRLDRVQREQLGQVLASAEQLLSLIDDLLELAGAGPAGLEARPLPEPGRPSAPALPAPAAPAPEATPAPPGPPSDGRPLKVLYAEDNPVNVTLLQMMARRRSDVVLTIARSGQDALAQARREPPDLLLADMNLGDMTGLELAATLRGEAANASLRCVALSADALPVQIEAARQAGFAGYLTKPLRMAELFKAFDETRAQIR